MLLYTRKKRKTSRSSFKECGKSSRSREEPQESKEVLYCILTYAAGTCDKGKNKAEYRHMR